MGTQFRSTIASAICQPEQLEEEKLRGSFRQADSEAGFVAGSSILLDNAPLSGAVDQRVSLGEKSRTSRDILFVEEAAHGANRVTKPRFAHTVDLRLTLSHPDALESRKRISH